MSKMLPYVFICLISSFCEPYSYFIPCCWGLSCLLWGQSKACCCSVSSCSSALVSLQSRSTTDPFTQLSNSDPHIAPEQEHTTFLNTYQVFTTLCEIKICTFETSHRSLVLAHCQHLALAQQPSTKRTGVVVIDHENTLMMLKGNLQSLDTNLPLFICLDNLSEHVFVEVWRRARFFFNFANFHSKGSPTFGPPVRDHKGFNSCLLFSFLLLINFTKTI